MTTLTIRDAVERAGETPDDTGDEDARSIDDLDPREPHVVVGHQVAGSAVDLDREAKLLLVPAGTVIDVMVFIFSVTERRRGPEGRAGTSITIIGFSE